MDTDDVENKEVTSFNKDVTLLKASTYYMECVKDFNLINVSTVTPGHGRAAIEIFDLVRVKGTPWDETFSMLSILKI